MKRYIVFVDDVKSVINEFKFNGAQCCVKSLYVFNMNNM
jgi:hypothetical protein